MPSIFRAYTPTVIGVQNTFYQQALSVAQASPVLATNVDPTLVHRKIWAILWSLTAGVSINWDLVGLMTGREIFRMQMVRYNGTVQRFFLGFNAIQTNIGGVSENLFVNIAQTTFYGVSPLRLNIAADTFYIDTNAQRTGGVSGAGSLWDAYLFVMSQAGI